MGPGRFHAGPRGSAPTRRTSTPVALPVVLAKQVFSTVLSFPLSVPTDPPGRMTGCGGRPAMRTHSVGVRGRPSELTDRYRTAVGPRVSARRPRPGFLLGRFGPSLPIVQPLALRLVQQQDLGAERRSHLPNKDLSAGVAAAETRDKRDALRRAVPFGCRHAFAAGHQLLRLGALSRGATATASASVARMRSGEQSMEVSRASRVLRGNTLRRFAVPREITPGPAALGIRDVGPFRLQAERAGGPRATVPAVAWADRREGRRRRSTSRQDPVD